MSYNVYYSEELLGIQDLSEISFEKNEDCTHIFIKHKRKECKCPNCGVTTNKIHDYREQKIKDLDNFGTRVILHLKKRRYCCPECGKRFYEPTPYLPKFARMTQRLSLAIIHKLRTVVTFTQVAKEHHVSVPTVIRLFDMIQYPKPELPVTVSIDEFKGNTGGEKYNCIIADPLKHKVLDILPMRYDHYITDYFSRYSPEKRDRVQIFVSDMWSPYQNTAKAMFKNATRVIDKYHWMRQITWAFERVRKDEQKRMSPELRKYFKHSRRLLLKRFDSLCDEDKQAVNVMLYYSPSISTAHYYKESFQKIAQCTSRAEAKKHMEEWILSAAECHVKPIRDCAKTMQNWKKEILDSFTTSCTNGFIEGCNNKIKVLKRIAFGYRNFDRFRNRILFVFTCD